MKYRTLGKTNLKVAEIGLGTWQLTNDPGLWSGSTEKESLECLYRYIELGGNFIDTAWVYGYSESSPNQHPSEELIGKFLKKTGWRNKIIIASKIPPKNMEWPAHHGTSISEIFPADHIIKCVEDSLKSLGVDYIDLMQFHVWQDYFAQDTEWKDTIEKITKSGKVRFWGISINDYQPSNCLKTLNIGLISTVQCIFNIFHQRPLTTLFLNAKKNNIGIIVRVPLDEGGLSGKFTSSTIFADGDFRSKYFTKNRLIELEQHLEPLKKIARENSLSMAELDFKFILSSLEVSTIIPGMRKIEYVEQNMKYSDGKLLQPEALKELAKHSWERNFYPDVDPYLTNTGYIESLTN